MRYPAVELLTGVVFALHAFVFEPGPLLLVRLVFAAVLIVLAFIDIDHRILPDSMTLTGIPLGVLASFWLPPGWRDSLIGVALGGGSLWLIAEGYYRWRKVEGMGMGDVKMLAMIGAVLGWRAVDRHARAQLVQRRPGRRPDDQRGPRTACATRCRSARSCRWARSPPAWSASRW